MEYISPFAEDFPKLPPIAGVRLSTACSGMRYVGRDDLLLVECANDTTVAGIFTLNTMCGAPIDWCKNIIHSGKARGLIVNAGIANVFTGELGTNTVKETANEVAELLNCNNEEVFVASTGIIGEQVDSTKLISALPTLKDKLQDTAWQKAARAIMTTDTFPKGISRTADIGGVEITINGIIKGSGMIAPNMATMLGYIFTDAKIPSDMLQALLNEDVKASYNCMTVDSDTSTSDMVLVFATGQADHWEVDDPFSVALTDFREKLQEVHVELAKLVAKDGEGLTKFLTIHVNGAESDEAARKIGLSIANSPLVKTAVAGEDPNWGRIIAAIGKSGEKTNRDKTSIQIGPHLVAEQGAQHPSYQEPEAAAYMKNKAIEFTIDVASGPGKATVWTSDLTHEYIRINVDYRS